MNVQKFLVKFYGISTIVGYSMPNCLYIFQIYMIKMEYFIGNNF